MATRGVVYVHSAPPALCPHIEWAVAGVLGTRIAFAWTAQPAAPGRLPSVTRVLRSSSPRT